MPTSSRAMCRIYALRQCYKNLKIKSSLFFWQNWRIISKLKPCNMQECKQEKHKKLNHYGSSKAPLWMWFGKSPTVHAFFDEILRLEQNNFSVNFALALKVSLSLCLWNKGCRRIEYSSPHCPEYTTMRLCFTRHFRWVPPGFTNEASWEVDISQRLKKQGPCISSVITLQ